MPRNYQEKYKQHLDDTLRYRAEPSANKESAQRKLDVLKRFACTLDIKDEAGEAPEKK